MNTPDTALLRRGVRSVPRPGEEQLKRRRQRRQQAHAVDLGVVDVGFQTLAGRPETATRVRRDLTTARGRLVE